MGRRCESLRKSGDQLAVGAFDPRVVGVDFSRPAGQIDEQPEVGLPTVWAVDQPRPSLRSEQGRESTERS